MTCERLQDVIFEVAAGTASDEDARALSAHIAAGCPTCAGRLAEAEAVGPEGHWAHLRGPAQAYGRSVTLIDPAGFFGFLSGRS